MKSVLALFVLSALFSATVFVAAPADSEVCESGICVVEFNASFNATNSVPWIEKLSDCSTSRVDIVSSPDLQQKHKIVVVPTIIIFNDGEEVERFQANIMMAIEASKSDVQEAVDEILMSSF
jgi:hypothetical protein|tara:strand:+ start:38 stop:403 length:366 start_codon:yes stop_codon:yes gene_type:complete